jgi:hypothetical protein
MTQMNMDTLVLEVGVGHKAHPIKKFYVEKTSNASEGID